jgi:hypothetical protein
MTTYPATRDRYFWRTFFEDLQKDIPRFSVQKWKPMVPTECDEMKIVSALVSRESSWHDGIFSSEQMEWKITETSVVTHPFANCAKSMGTRQPIEHDSYLTKPGIKIVSPNLALQPRSLNILARRRVPSAA